MSIIKEDYKELGTKLSLLSDTVVLAQAWKKAHAYIRRHNWYADVLELDVSAVNLDAHLKTWATEIAKAGYKPEALRVVPAPKNCKWVFDGDEWKPKPKETHEDKNKDDGVPLRPLAHLNIREQVLNTAVMLCLANAVETAQGCPELEPLEARKRGVASYGNRLHCQWREGVDGEQSIADHSWGSSKCYSEYFEHYQKFLSRPVTVCQSLSAELRHDRELYVVKLDLKSFFDKVDVPALRQELKRIDQTYREKVGRQSPKKEQVDQEDQFWNAVERLHQWNWHEQDCPDSELFATDEDADCIPLGLPQGMVASGFLANAYLNQFDAQLTQQCFDSTKIVDLDVELLDYCRYVDDIRLVVSASNSSEVDAVKNAVQAHINGCLEKHKNQIGATQLLKLNAGKTEVQLFKSIGFGTVVSARMQAISAGGSGPFVSEDLSEILGDLEGLLWLSEQLEVEDASEAKNHRHRLAKILQPVSDVRDDTVKRFVATRLVKTMREQLAMADLDSPADNAVQLGNKVLTRDQLKHEFRRVARRLIKIWAHNPSLIILLRCAFDLFPDAELLKSVQESLIELIEVPADGSIVIIKKKRLAFYVIADLLRAGAVETGYREAEAYPEGSDIEGYRECLTMLAKRMLQKELAAPWYVQQQAYLYLSSQNDVSTRIVFKGALKEVKRYLKLQQMLRYRDVSEKDLLVYLPFVLVAQQVKPDRARLATWLLTNLEGRSRQDKNEVTSFLISVDPALLVELLGLNRKLKVLLSDHLPECVKLYVQESLHKRKTLNRPGN